MEGRDWIFGVVSSLLLQQSCNIWGITNIVIFSCMPRDHYVAQTYLRNFANSNGQLFPYYKSGRVIAGKPISPRSVCCEENGSSTKYLIKPRALELFLRPIEKSWNEHLTAVKQGKHTPEMRYEIASYLACLRTCTPTAIRKMQKNLSTIVGTSTKILAKKGVFYNEEFSPQLNKKMISLIHKDKVEYVVDPEYALARAIISIPPLINNIFHADWKFLFNKSGRFFTSDNPLCLYYPNNNPQYAWWYAPLMPDFAIVIKFDVDFNYEQACAKKIQMGNTEYGEIKEKYEMEFNINLIRCAENNVFYNSKQSWLEKLVAENIMWRTESLNDVLPTETGNIIISRDRPIRNQHHKKQ